MLKYLQARTVPSAEIIVFLLQPQKGIPDRDVFIERLCNYFRGRGGDDPSLSVIVRYWGVDGSA